MSAISNSLFTIFWAVVTFSILVVLHEGGHFLAARAFGVRVHEFMIGLPGPAVRVRSKKTKTAYGITAVPLGGYVRIAGMEPGPEDELLGPALVEITRARRMNATQLSAVLGIDAARAESLLVSLADWDAIAPAEDSADDYLALMAESMAGDEKALLDAARKATFRGLPVWKRVVLLAMGVFVNLLTAILIFTIVLSLYGYYTQSLIVDKVVSGSGAVAAGLKPGDRLTSVDGVKVKDWQAFTTQIDRHKAGETVTIGYVREGTERTARGVLKARPDGQGAFLGVQASVKHIHPNPFQAVKDSFAWTGMVFVAVADFFRPSTFKQSIEGARSVVGISVEVAAAVRNGPLDFAWIVALLSLSLGVMNLIPIPPLDGGKIAVELTQKVIGRPLSRRVSYALSAAGTLLLFSLIGYLVYADVMRYIVRA
ncbi:MAG TPA: M50 family metallopeptidase [Candidatus Limnocylindrales bacterium]